MLELNYYAHVVEGRVVGKYEFSEPVETAGYIAVPTLSDIANGDLYVDSKFVKSESLSGPINETNLCGVAIKAIAGEGLVKHKSDFSFVTLLKDTPVVVSATLPIPDSTFVLGVKRADGGYENFLVRVTDGKAEITLTLSQNNSYSVTEAELNRDLAEPMFSLETPIKIDVVTA